MSVPPPQQMQGSIFEPAPVLDSKPCVSLRAGGPAGCAVVVAAVVGVPLGGVLWGPLAGWVWWCGGVRHGSRGVRWGSALDPLCSCRFGLGFLWVQGRSCHASHMCPPHKATRKCALRTLGLWSSRITPKPLRYHQIIPKGEGRSSWCVTIIKVDFPPPAPPPSPAL